MYVIDQLTNSIGVKHTFQINDLVVVVVYNEKNIVQLCSMNNMHINK